jgi:hypothetical protein
VASVINAVHLAHIGKGFLWTVCSSRPAGFDLKAWYTGTTDCE